MTHRGQRDTGSTTVFPQGASPDPEADPRLSSHDGLVLVGLTLPELSALVAHCEDHTEGGALPTCPLCVAIRKLHSAWPVAGVAERLALTNGQTDALLNGFRAESKGK